MRVLIWDEYNDDWIKHTPGGKEDLKIHEELAKIYKDKEKND